MRWMEMEPADAGLEQLLYVRAESISASGYKRLFSGVFANARFQVNNGHP
jgi:hypothetical protein